MIHGLRNLLIGGASIIIPAVGFLSLLSSVSRWAEEHRFGILNAVTLPTWAHALGSILLLDVATYWWHRANHRVPFLWRFHRVHHADSQMDVTTASRFHIGEIAISSALRVPFVPFVGVRMWELAVFETAMLAIVQFRHANIWIGTRWDQALRAFIVTPAMHKVHHSRWKPETDSNFTAMLSIWDRLFRSFRLRDDPRGIHLGLGDFDTPTDRTVVGILKIPLADVEKRRMVAAYAPSRD